MRISEEKVHHEIVNRDALEFDLESNLQYEKPVTVDISEKKKKN